MVIANLLAYPRRSIAALALITMAAASFAYARGGSQAVDAELVLAVDVSYSMDEAEQKLQRAGYVAALNSPDFLQALHSGPLAKIAVAYMEWASSADQKVLAGWTLIDSPESAASFAAKLSDAPYRRASRTSISGAIDASMRSSTETVSPARGASSTFPATGRTTMGAS